jgi:hypothetical protein
MSKQKLKQIVVRSYDEAYKIGKPYIKTQTHPHAVPGQFTMPSQVGEPVWEMSTKALENTLKYVCEYLHHQCYMLCVKDNDVLLCKLEMGTTAPVFSEIIGEQLWDVNANPTMTPKQVKFVQDSVEKNIDKLRVMQCVVKPYATGNGPDADTSNNEYLELIKGLDLPDGVFILNLTDAIILRNDGNAPFTMVTGKADMGKYNFDKHIPILSMSWQRNYLDIPMPNYDDIANFYKTNPKMKTKWSDKKIAKAVFRGGPTGCGYTERTNMRIKLAMMDSPLLDVELTGKGATIDSNSIRFDPKYGLGMLNTGIPSSKSFLTMADQSHYKYIIHVDGNVNAYRLLTTMATGSLILRVTSQYKSWVDHLIKHMEHYVPVKADLSDLLGVIQWCKKHDAECQRIAQTGAEFARKVLSEAYVKGYFKQLLWTVSGMDPTTQQKPKKKAPKAPNAVHAKSAIAVITIFRDNDEGKREIQRRTFIERMNAVLEPYKYHIFIIEQSQDGNPFNIGKLKNVGFDIVNDYEKKHKGMKFTNFIFTDIDMLPDDELLPYYTNPIDGILSLAIRGTRYEQMDSQTKKVFLGGVLGFDRDSFEEINGYPNNFWGWGGEDDALIYRLVASNVSTIHMPKSGKVVDLEEKMTVQEKLKKTVIDGKKWEKLFIDTTNWRTNGMSTLEYKLLTTTKENPNTTQYKVDLLKDVDEKAHPELYNTDGLKFKWDNRADRKKITDEYAKLGLEELEILPIEVIPKKAEVPAKGSLDDEYMTFPENKKRCPTGYSSTMKNGIKVCKKNKTRKKK